tara:strand:+ start:386 stop:1030 length:645 start_codon:yes stop_codon:yes gene_type:complete
VFVPKSEGDSYRRAHPQGAIVEVPEDVRGITPTRNWILDYAKQRYVVFVDDDVMGAGYWVVGVEGKQKVSMKEPALMQEWLRLFHLTDDLGYHLWGAETTGDYISVHPHKPFVWHGYVTASCMGIVNDGLRFDPAYPVKEDYELSLRCIKEDGGIVGARYLFWKNAHWVTPGGCADYRTQGMEDAAISNLMAAYPGMIKKVTKGGSQYSIRIDF